MHGTFLGGGGGLGKNFTFTLRPTFFVIKSFQPSPLPCFAALDVEETFDTLGIRVIETVLLNDVLKRTLCGDNNTRE